MNITPLRSAILAGAAFAVLVVGSPRASADTFDIQIGAPPPPPRVEIRWAQPYRDAVWIHGHHEWDGRRYFWVGGYYTYPPYRGAYWIDARWHRGVYHRGHWDRR